MPTSLLYNRARMNTATTGTGTMTLSTAVTAHATFAEAGVQNADVVTYCIEDGDDFEIGRGTYTSSGTTLSRDTVLLSKISGTAGTSKINLSGSAIVFITAAKEDFDVNDFTEDTSPEGAADFHWMYDNSAGRKKKVKPSNNVRTGGLQLLASGTVSNQATLDIALTSYTGYRSIVILLQNVIPASDDQALYMRFSTDGGANYDAGASDYMFYTSAANSNGSAVVASSSANAQLILSSNSASNKLSSDSGSAGDFVVELTSRLSGTLKSRALWHGSYINTTPIGVWCNGSGFRNSAQDTDAVRFLMASGNISCDYAVYGRA